MDLVKENGSVMVIGEPLSGFCIKFLEQGEKDCRLLALNPLSSEGGDQRYLLLRDICIHYFVPNLKEQAGKRMGWE
jgi:hypothetical protein